MTTDIFHGDNLLSDNSENVELLGDLALQTHSLNSYSIKCKNEKTVFPQCIVDEQKELNISPNFDRFLLQFVLKNLLEHLELLIK